MFRRNPVSEPRPQSKKPGFCENLRILTRCSEETRFLIPAPNPRNRVSTSIYAASPDVPKKPGFCTPPPIQETGFLRAFTPPHQMFRRNPVSEPRPQSKKPGFYEHLRILTRCSEETRFLIPAPNPRNRVSTSIYASSPDFPKKPGF